jgi:hypothetical protein
MDGESRTVLQSEVGDRGTGGWGEVVWEEIAGADAALRLYDDQEKKKGGEK